MHACAHTHTHACAHVRAHTHTHLQCWKRGWAGAVKNSLEIVIKQVHLEGGFKRGGTIRMVECLRQISVFASWCMLKSCQWCIGKYGDARLFFFFLLFLGKLWRLVWSCVKLAVMSSPVSCSQGTHQCHMIDFVRWHCFKSVRRLVDFGVSWDKTLPKHTYLFKKVWRQNLIDFGVSWG